MGGVLLGTVRPGRGRGQRRARPCRLSKSRPQVEVQASRPLTAAPALEVLGRDLVEELAELLDLVLLLSSGMLMPGLVEHRLGAEDRRAGAQRERDRVGRAGR